MAYLQLQPTNLKSQSSRRNAAEEREAVSTSIRAFREPPATLCALCVLGFSYGKQVSRLRKIVHERTILLRSK